MPPHPTPSLGTGRRIAAALALLVLFLGVAPLVSPPLWGNGGTLRVANASMGAYLVSIFTDPTPVRPDSLDVSILVLQEGVEGLAEGVEVEVRIRSADHPGPGTLQPATREQADDPRYHAAKFALDHPGRWQVEVAVSGPAGSGSVEFELTARDPGLLGNPFVLMLLSLVPLGAAGWWLLRDKGSEGS